MTQRSSPFDRIRALSHHGAVALTLLALLAGPAASHAPLPSEIAEISRRIAAGPPDAERFLRRAELWRLAGRPRDAEADCRNAERLEPGLPGIALCRAALNLDAGRPEAALPLIEARLAHHPDDPDALRLLVRAHEARGDWEAMAAAGARLVDSAIGPTPADVLDLARAEQHGSGEPSPARLERALAALEAGIARVGAAPVLEIAAAEIERSLGRPDPAAEREARWTRALQEPAAAPAADVSSGGSATPPPARTSSTSGAVAVTTLPRFSNWKYHAQGIDLGTTWRDAAYVDTTWPTGPGILGYGDPFITTTIPYGPNAAAKYPTTYFRARFTPADPPASITALTLNVNYDDGFAAFLNGVEIARRGLAAGAGYAALAANHEGGSWESIDVGAFRGALVAGVNVLAVEVHQTTLGSSDLAFDAELIYGTGAPALVRGPWLQRGTPSSVTIRWRTDQPTDSRVWYGVSPGGMTATQDDPALTTEHEVVVTGLLPETRYDYAVGSTTALLAGLDGSCTFRTFPPTGAPSPARFWILGDSGLPGTMQNGVRDAWESWSGGDAADVWLMLGDNAYNAGTDSEYQAGLFTPYAAQLKKTILWTTRGNHDVLYSGAANDYYDLFTLPTAGEAGGVPSGTEAYYSFDYGDIHCVCLDSEGTSRSVNGAMLNWLRLDLAASSQAWTVAFWHHPPYTKGSHDSDDPLDSGGRMRDMRTNVLPILDSLGVDLVLTGHSHSYERSVLLREHYGTSGSLAPSMIVDGGTGDPNGDGAYVKPTPGAAPREGAVYAVAGSAARTDGGPLNHPAMVRSLNVGGSLILDFAGNRMDGHFLDQSGTIRDTFTLIKGTGSSVPEPGGRDAAFQLGPPSPNPASGVVAFPVELGSEATVRLHVLDVAGRRVRTLDGGVLAAGRHEIRWDGTGGDGRRVAPGVYFVRLESGGRVRGARIVRLR